MIELMTTFLSARWRFWNWLTRQLSKLTLWAQGRAALLNTRRENARVGQEESVAGKEACCGRS